MSVNLRLGAVLLAAGQSVRFGGNKLLADFCGMPMVCRAMQTMAALPAERLAVVAADAQTASLARARGMLVIQNDAPQMGQSHSICLAVQAMADLDAVLFMAADQPLLTDESLLRLLNVYLRSGKGAACLEDRTHQGNPAVFSSRYFSELLALRGDCGAKRVLRAHEDDLCVVSCVRDDELSDADTPQALERMRNVFFSRE